MKHPQTEQLTTTNRFVQPNTFGKSIVRVTRGLWLFGKSNTSLAILDQAVVSGTRFLATIFIGRMCGKEELGVYVLTFAIYLIFGCVQEALITTPYMVFGNRLHGRARRTLAGSVLLHSMIFSLAAVTLITSGALIAWFGFGQMEVSPTVLSMAMVLPFVLLWEFGRRYALAHLNLKKALALDVATATLQVAGIAWLAWQTRLSSVTGYLAMGAGCACCGVTWFLLSRSEFQVDRPQVDSDWWKNWRFGRWVLAAQIIGLMQAYTPAWVLLFAIGTSATGVFSACENIVLLSNPLILAMANLFGATTAQAYAEGGYRAVRKVVLTASLYSSIAMFVLWFVLVLVGGHIVTLFYGAAFTGNGGVVSTIALAAPFWAVSCALAMGLRAVERPDAEFGGKVMGFLVTFVVSVLVVRFAEVQGMAYSLVIGSATTTCWQAWTFYRVVPAETPDSNNRL